MRKQHAATIRLFSAERRSFYPLPSPPPARGRGWIIGLKFERRIAIDYFFRIGNTRSGVCPAKHVSVARHIIRKRQPAAIELRVQSGWLVPRLKRRSCHSYSPAHFAIAASVSSFRQSLRSKSFGLFVCVLVVGLLVVLPDWDDLFAVLIVLESFNGG